MSQTHTFCILCLKNYVTIKVPTSSARHPPTKNSLYFYWSTRDVRHTRDVTDRWRQIQTLKIRQAPFNLGFDPAEATLPLGALAS